MVRIEGYVFDDSELLENLSKREMVLKKKECKKKARRSVGADLKHARKNKLVLYSVPLSGVLTTGCIGLTAFNMPNSFLTTVSAIAAGTTVLLMPPVIELIQKENKKIHDLKIKENYIYSSALKRICNFEELEEYKRLKRAKIR